MLYTIVVLLLILWLLGNIMAFTAGDLIHLLLVSVIVVTVTRVISGRLPA